MNFGLYFFTSCYDNVLVQRLRRTYNRHDVVVEWSNFNCLLRKESYLLSYNKISGNLFQISPSPLLYSLSLTLRYRCDCISHMIRESLSPSILSLKGEFLE